MALSSQPKEVAEDVQRQAQLRRVDKDIEHLMRARYPQFAEDQFVIAGSPATVRDQLKEAIKTLRIGNLMLLLGIGSMPHELVLKNTKLFFDEVAPAIRDMWDDEWSDRWWPAGLQEKRRVAVPA